MPFYRFMDRSPQNLEFVALRGKGIDTQGLVKKSSPNTLALIRFIKRINRKSKQMNQFLAPSLSLRDDFAEPSVLVNNSPLSLSLKYCGRFKIAANHYFF